MSGVPSEPAIRSSMWSIVRSPNVLPPDGLYGDVLNSISGIATNDIWAVGDVCCYQGNRSHSFDRALIEHWNGSKWKIVPFATEEPPDTYLNGVAEVSKNDAWAVGNGLFASSQFLQPLFEHWNGKQWGLVRIPNIYYGGEMYSVVAISSKDVWAAGYLGFGAAVEHWDGTSWSFVPSYSYGVSELRSIAASGPNDVWAVGDYYGYNDNTSPFAERWNGSKWIQYLPVNQFYASGLYGVVDLSPTNVWAVGYQNPSEGTGMDAPQTLIEHWDGYKWNLVTSPNKEPKGPLQTNWLFGIAGRPSTDLWAVGYWVNYPGSGSLFLHWNGKKWHIAPGPPALESKKPDYANQLLGITNVGSSDLWAVGSRNRPLVGTESLTVQAAK